MKLKKFKTHQPRQTRALSDGVQSCKAAISERNVADFSLFRARLLEDFATLLAWLDDEASEVDLIN